MSGPLRYAAVAGEDLEDLTARYAPLVKRIAYHLIARLPRSISAEDLIQAGLIGLIEAARHYDPTQGASFETYAGIRIRGAMLDEVRRHDWSPRSVHRKARALARAIRTVEGRFGREARDEEIAATLGLTLEEYHRTLAEVSGHRILGFEEAGVDEGEIADGLRDPQADPLGALEASERRERLAAAIAQLPERERLVLSLYYNDELNLKEIGEVLGVSESRVCQIHGQALLRLRARLADIDAPMMTDSGEG
jgi:RNA polymerase sigma factor for flagellar operon FliA